MIITDSAVHPLDYFDSYFSQVYTPREVSAQSFAADVAAGLWTYSGDVVLTNAESLIFRYYTPDNVLIKSESVSIVSDGKNAVAMTSPTTPPGSYTGQIGMYAGHFYQWNGSEWILQDTATTADVAEYTPRYLGMFASYPTDAHAGDWCVLSGNGILYLYTGASWQAITDYADSQYTRLFMSAMGDLFALAKNTGEQLFVSRLVALTAFIQTLFSKQIVISSDGTISSKKFTSGSEGFCIQGNGTAEFNNGIFNKGTFDDITVNSGTFNDIKINNSQPIFTNSVWGEMPFPNFLKMIETKHGFYCSGYFIISFWADGDKYTFTLFPTKFVFVKNDHADIEGNVQGSGTSVKESGNWKGHLYITNSSANLTYRVFSLNGPYDRTYNIDMNRTTIIYCDFFY